ncbi:unnamed protein product [Caenorhabditis auriculariae]|uniref:Serpentine receptor class gamma n=1 Tax=Caenorhabditis auriculariae TaxID=2777116 RepID=A0A8S1H0S9_9PELO|nr:unnamed protein product [Caenorhabditis auriculariae]
MPFLQWLLLFFGIISMMLYGFIVYVLTRKNLNSVLKGSYFTIVKYQLIALIDGACCLFTCIFCLLCYIVTLYYLRLNTYKMTLTSKSDARTSAEKSLLLSAIMMFCVFSLNTVVQVMTIWLSYKTVDDLLFIYDLAYPMIDLMYSCSPWTLLFTSATLKKQMRLELIDILRRLYRLLKSDEFLANPTKTARTTHVTRLRSLPSNVAVQPLLNQATRSQRQGPSGRGRAALARAKIFYYKYKIRQCEKFEHYRRTFKEESITISMESCSSNFATAKCATERTFAADMWIKGLAATRNAGNIDVFLVVALFSFSRSSSVCGGLLILWLWSSCSVLFAPFSLLSSSCSGLLAQFFLFRGRIVAVFARPRLKRSINNLITHLATAKCAIERTLAAHNQEQGSCRDAKRGKEDVVLDFASFSFCCFFSVIYVAKMVAKTPKRAFAKKRKPLKKAVGEDMQDYDICLKMVKQWVDEVRPTAKSDPELYGNAKMVATVTKETENSIDLAVNRDDVLGHCPPNDNYSCDDDVNGSQDSFMACDSDEIDESESVTWNDLDSEGRDEDAFSEKSEENTEYHVGPVSEYAVLQYIKLVADEKGEQNGKWKVSAVPKHRKFVIETFREVEDCNDVFEKKKVWTNRYVSPHGDVYIENVEWYKSEKVEPNDPWFSRDPAENMEAYFEMKTLKLISTPDTRVPLKDRKKKKYVQPGDEGTITGFVSYFKEDPESNELSMEFMFIPLPNDHDVIVEIVQKVQKSQGIANGRLKKYLTRWSGEVYLQKTVWIETEDIKLDNPYYPIASSGDSEGLLQIQFIELISYSEPIEEVPNGDNLPPTSPPWMDWIARNPFSKFLNVEKEESRDEPPGPFFGSGNLPSRIWFAPTPDFYVEGEKSCSEPLKQNFGLPRQIEVAPTPDLYVDRENARRASPRQIYRGGSLPWLTMRLPLFLMFLHVVGANLLMPGIYTETIEVMQSKYQLIGVPQAALNQTAVQIELFCNPDLDLTFDAEFVLRSSPCDKEFFNSKDSQRRQNLVFYYNESNQYHIPDTFDYPQIVYYRSKVQSISCKGSHGRFVFPNATGPMVLTNVTKVPVVRSKRASEYDKGMKTFHPAQSIPMDGIYYLIVKIVGTSFPAKSLDAVNVTVTVEWKAPYGYLSAIDWPLLRFYKMMCVFYAILALIWLTLCIRHYRDILRIQYWIGAVIVLGMVEKAFFLIDGILELAEIVSCGKKTMSRVLVIIVSLGYGVVKPRLGNTMNQVAGVGLVYFVFCSIEGIARVSKNTVEAAKQKQFASLPLVLTEMVIFYWIFTSLTATMRTLRLKRNEVKLSVYRHFTNTLIFAVLSSIVFMVWSMFYHIFPTCRVDWKELWVDTAFWHVLFCFILVVIMTLWRPSQNNQQYAFTPLLDDSEDENDQDELFNTFTPGYDVLTARNSGAGAEQRRQRESDKDQQRKEDRLKEDLRWIEENVPSSLTDQLLGSFEDPEEQEAKQLEISKML